MERFYFITDKVLNNNLEVENKSMSHMHAKGFFVTYIRYIVFDIYMYATICQRIIGNC